MATNAEIMAAITALTAEVTALKGAQASKPTRAPKATPATAGGAGGGTAPPATEKKVTERSLLRNFDLRHHLIPLSTTDR